MAFCDFEIIFEVLCVSEFCAITMEMNKVLKPTLVKKKLLIILNTYICLSPIVPPADTIICKGDNGDLGTWKGK